MTLKHLLAYLCGFTVVSLPYKFMHSVHQHCALALPQSRTIHKLGMTSVSDAYEFDIEYLMSKKVILTVSFVSILINVLRCVHGFCIAKSSKK